jgi:hypothetical protein
VRPELDPLRRCALRQPSSNGLRFLPTAFAKSERHS